MRKKLPEEETLEAPRQTNMHTEAECDVMLALPLEPDVRDAWLDERLLASQAMALHRPNAPEEPASEEEVEAA